MVKNFLLTMFCAVFIATNAMADGAIPFNFQGLQANGDDNVATPSKFKRLDVTVEGEPEEDKIVTVEIELNHLEGYDDGASHAFLRMTSPYFYDENEIERSQIYDLHLDPVDGNDHVLRGSLEISRYCKAGYWTTNTIEVTDLQGNVRYNNLNDSEWNMYVNNALEDLISPKYESGSLTYEVTDTVVDGHQEQNLRVSYKVTDNTGISSVFCRMHIASDNSYDAYGKYDSITQMAHIDIPITEYGATGDYYVEHITFYDYAQTSVSVVFSDSTYHEPRKTIHITTPNPDTIAPELDLNRMYIYAEPTHPDAPDGETLVTLTYYARDDKSGLGDATYRLRDPQGGLYFFWSVHRNFYTKYFDGDPTVWEKYTYTTILPQGSVPGIWGLAEVWLSDKTGNANSSYFTETNLFELNHSTTDYTLYTSLDENHQLTFDLTSETKEGYGYQYRVICDNTGQEISGVVPAGENTKQVIDVSDWIDGKIVVITQILDKEGNLIAICSKTQMKSAETWKAIEMASEEYQNYISCSETGMTLYQQMTEEKTANSGEAAQILGNIEPLKGKIAESKMTDEDKNSFLATLSKATESVSALQAESDSIFNGNAFYDIVQASGEAVAAFNDRMAQYAERLKTVTTIEMLNTLKAEIEQDIEDFETAYLNPVMTNFQDMEQKKPRLAEIAKELEDCKTQIQTCEEEVDSLIVKIAFAEKQAEMEALHQKAMAIYEEYMSYYDGGIEFYQQVTEEQVANSTAAMLILSNIEPLEGKIAGAAMSDEEKDSFLATLNGVKDSASALKSENDGILVGNAFYNKVLEHSEAMTTFYGRLKQYTISIESAATIEELDTLQTVIEQDAKETETAYLAPVASQYQDLEQRGTRLTEIGKELEECKAQMQACEEEVDNIIARILAEKQAEIKDVYQKAQDVYAEYMSYAEGDGMEFYQQITKEQATNSGTAVQILNDIKALESKIDESGIANEDKTSLLAALHNVKDIASALQAENDGILDGNTFYNKVQEHSEAVTAFYGRLKQYTVSIESAETIEELNTLKADIVQDFESFDTACLTPVAGEHQALESISPRLAEIAQELEDCKAKLQSQADVIDAIITGISTISNDENEDVTVYTLNGLKQTMKRKELKSLPSGIYIINGKKYVTTRP